jgi:hypothetical protein
MAALAVEAFHVAPTTTTRNLPSTALLSASEPCPMPSNIEIPESVTAASLRSAQLTNIDGELINLGDRMGKGTSIVIFLRHLG